MIVRKLRQFYTFLRLATGYPEPNGSRSTQMTQLPYYGDLTLIGMDEEDKETHRSYMQSKYGINE